MDFIDLIEKKKLGKAHTKEEINQLRKETCLKKYRS